MTADDDHLHASVIVVEHSQNLNTLFQVCTGSEKMNDECAIQRRKVDVHQAWPLLK